MPNCKKAIIYYDGFNLYSGIMEKGFRKYRWLNLEALADKVAPAGYKIEKIKYFTTRIKGDPSKHQRQQTYLNALKAHIGERIDIIFGRFQSFPSRCKHCGASPVYCHNCQNEIIKPNEKKTDVNIATSMLVDCFENKTEAIILVSGDSDFERPLEEIGRVFPHIHRLIAFPPMRKNPTLDPFCDDCITINLGHLLSAGLLPNPVINLKNGNKYIKPATW